MDNMKKIPVLRFPEFSGEWEEKDLKGLAENGFSNGVFNDPNKVGAEYKLINVSDMYLETTIDENKLNLSFKKKPLSTERFFVSVAISRTTSATAI